MADQCPTCGCPTRCAESQVERLRAALAGISTILGTGNNLNESGCQAVREGIASALRDSDEWGSSCPKAIDGSDQHCDHWYDDAAPCCWCGDDGDHEHGDPHPSLDCKVCSFRITAGHTTMAKLMEAHG